MKLLKTIFNDFLALPYLYWNKMIKRKEMGYLNFINNKAFHKRDAFFTY